jgi:hypothetical protein
MNTADLQAKPALRDIETRIAADHRRIHVLLDELDRTAEFASRADAPQDADRELAGPLWELFLAVDDHLAFEERDLVPLLIDAGGWGKVQVEHLHAEHRSQRTALMALVNECDQRIKPGPEVADDAAWLVWSLRKDIAHEEADLRALHEPPREPGPQRTV